MGLFDRFRKPKDTGQVSMDGAVDARSASTAGPSGAAQAAGACRSGDAAVVVGADGASVVGETTIVGIEAFRKRVDVARQGDMVGLMLRGVSREQVHAGDIVVVRQ